MSQRIRIKLQSYDHNLVDKSADKIVKTVRSTGAVVTGPIPLPTRTKIFTVLRSPHVNKKSREQFQLATHKRLLDIYTSTSRTVDMRKGIRNSHKFLLLIFETIAISQPEVKLR
jgi:small subunit ribosomal protein S10